MKGRPREPRRTDGNRQRQRPEKKARTGKGNVRNQKVRKRKDQQKEVSYEIKRTSGDSEILTGAEAWKFQATKKSCDRKLFTQ